MTVLRVPCVADPWGANQAPKSTRERIQQSRRKADLRDAVTLVARSHFARSPAALPLGPSSIQVTIPFRTKRKRDGHNYTSTVCKSIVDGLVRAGYWEDDTADFVTIMDPILVVGHDYIITINPRAVRTFP